MLSSLLESKSFHGDFFKIEIYFLLSICFVVLYYFKILLVKFAYREEFEGNTKRSTAAYKKVREDVSTGLTYKLPLEVEFYKKYEDI
ncbi:tRNA pseudouridine synthase B [Rickettsia endosymbiont of Ixodes scapularis]|nr:tRNA pseudouridine synthase B [Rickettsia endosymbiont of Ixodes scapularis]